MPDVPTVADALEVSAAWAALDAPAVSVVVSTFRRPGYLDELVAAMEALDPPAGGHEVVVVDNGSGDATWERLCALVAGTTLAVAAVRLPANRGPGGGRNAGVAVARGAVVAFTDDDCLPTPGWLPALVAPFADAGVAVVQGAVAPEPNQAAAMGPWDHTVSIPAPTPWFETSNVAYRMSALRAVGGFDEHDPVTARHAGGRAFGEDAVLGWRVVDDGGGRAWAGQALVHHRCVPGRWRDFLAARRWMAGFPALAERSGVVRDGLRGGVFLDDDTLAVDLAVCGVVAAATTRRAWPLLAAGPWLRRRWPDAVHRAGGRAGAPVRLAQRFVVDAYGAAQLVRGSVEHRRLVL